MAQNSWVNASISRYVGVAHTCCYHLDQELIFPWFARQQLFPIPVMLRVGHNAFARYRVVDHASLLR